MANRNKAVEIISTILDMQKKGYTNREIALQLGISESNVRMILGREKEEK